MNDKKTVEEIPQRKLSNYQLLKYENEALYLKIGELEQQVTLSEQEFLDAVDTTLAELEQADFAGVYQCINRFQQLKEKYLNRK